MMAQLYPLLYGLIATAIMSAVLYLIGQLGTGAAARVKGIGSAIPTPAGGSQVPGAVVHIVAGVAFAYAFWGLGRAWAYLQPGQLVLLGAGMGVLRGGAVSLVLGVLAFDRDPLDAMARSGVGVGIVHVLGNVLYGVCVAVLFGLSAVDFALSF